MKKKLNESKIDYLDYVFNAVTGCKHGCPRCWAAAKFHRFKKDFTPQFHPERLEWPANTEKPGIVGVVFEGDLFGKWVPTSWIEQVFEACEAAPQHLYLFLTKNPARYDRVDSDKIKRFSCFGFSAIDLLDYRDKCMSYNPIKNKHNTFVSYEPLKGRAIFGAFTEWIIVGAQTQPLKLPELEWVLDLRKQAKELNIPIFEKNNLKNLNLPGGLIQELHPKIQKFREGINE